MDKSSPIRESLLAADDRDSLNSQNQQVVVITNATFEISESSKLFTSIGYALAIGYCGLIVVSMGTSLNDLSNNVDSTPISDGIIIFIVRWLGNILGAVLSTFLIRGLNGNNLLAICFIINIPVLILLPFNKSLVLLNVYFFILGLTTSVIDTSCLYLTRILHGKEKAGPWLGFNVLMFSVSGILAPIIYLIASTPLCSDIGILNIQFYVLAFLTFTIGVTCYVAKSPKLPPPPPSPPNTQQNQSDTENAQGPSTATTSDEPQRNIYVSILIGLMLFNFVGGYFSATFYLVSYVLETGAILSSNASVLVLVLWLSITIGRVFGILDSKSLLPPSQSTNLKLRLHMTSLMTISFVSSLLVIVLPSNGAVLWASVAFYGATIGPCVGFAFDLSNRLTRPDPVTMSYVMHGLNAGANLSPFFVSFWWDYGGGPSSLFWIIFIGVAMSIPLLYLSFYLSAK